MQIVSSAPANIALVKYWGKYGVQLPRNPSLSFTLSKSITTMNVDISKNGKRIFPDVDFLFDKQVNDKFRKKIVDFLTLHRAHFPFLETYSLAFESSNTFPHSAGIASSASSMAALALVLCQAEQQLTGGLQNNSEFLRQASFLARLASGSACRSVYEGIAVWGQTPYVPLAHNEYAVPIENEVHSVFRNFQDTVLLVDAGEKSVSSRAGHALMEEHPFAQTRYQQAHTHLGNLLASLQKGDIQSFIRIVENEALTLHGLMMNSNPSFILLKPNTLRLIELIRTFRNDTAIPVAFTLDAGPNVHLLYPESEKEKVINFIEQTLKPICENQRCIYDFVK